MLPFFILILFSASAHSDENKNNYSSNAKHTANTEEYGTDRLPITVKILPSPDAESKAAQDEERRKEKAQEDHLLTWGTIVLAGVTTILAIFTGCLWWVTRKLALDARSTSEKQAEELRKIERAFVYLEGFEQEMAPAGEDTRLTLRPLWRNSGNTPTIDMHVWVNWCLYKGMPDIGFPYDFKSSHGQRFFLAPRAIEGSEFIEITTADVHEAIQASSEGGEDTQKHIYIWGTVTYYDIFGQRHFTKFCYRIDFSAPDRKTLRANFVQWGNNNRTDDTPEADQELNHYA